MDQRFANFRLLAQFIFRLDRIKIPLWIFGLVVLTIMMPPALENMYKTQEERDLLAETMMNPVMTAMLGTGDLENYTTGVMTAHQMLVMTAVIIGIMAILLVTRHTRGDEEDGRLEMIRSLPTGRLAYLNASLLVASTTFVVLAIIIGLGLYALRIDSLDLEGSILYGAVLGGIGIVFTGVAAVFAQLSESSRGTIGYSVALLIVAYLFRAVTDISNEQLSWLSPIGWVSKAEVYSSNNWLPVIMMIVFSIILFIIANYLNSIRDLEQGFIAAKSGRSTASRFLQSPIGLAFRLQRTGTIAWAVGMYVLGASYGSIFGDLEAFFEGNDIYMQMLVQLEGASIVEQFIPTLMLVIALLATIPPVLSLNKLHGEEKKDRLDHLISKAVSRTNLIGSYIVLAVINGFIMLSMSTFGLWSSAVMVMEEGLDFGMVYYSAIVYFPAMLVIISIAAFLNGYLPKKNYLVWMYLIYSFFVLYLGAIIQFPEWAGKLSPFHYVPQVPIERLTFMPMFILSFISIILFAISIFCFRRRDVKG